MGCSRASWLIGIMDQYNAVDHWSSHSGGRRFHPCSHALRTFSPAPRPPYFGGVVVALFVLRVIRCF